jgi:ribonuclease HI
MSELINSFAPEPELVINTDGGARGNPGPAGIGVVISTPEGRHLESFGKYIGETTNNQAEYLAVVEALKAAAKYQPTKLRFILDSELVVKQLKGIYRVKHPDLQPLHAHILEHTRGQAVSFEHVLRAKNKLADIEVNKAIDHHLSAG